MNNIFLTLLLIICTLISCKPTPKEAIPNDNPVVSFDSTSRTNDFYDNEPTVVLAGSPVIEIAGEVAAPVTVNLADLPVRSVIVKETRIVSGEVEFTGAYRYDGISLYDILDQVNVVKKNAAEFEPVIDQYVVVYNSAGDSVVVSWGELYYPSQRHQIIVGQRVMRIVPSKTRDHWPLPVKARLIVGTDLITERNIDDPVKIFVRSIGLSYKVDRSIKLWAPELDVIIPGNQVVVLKELPSTVADQQCEHVFYGRGRGIHGITKTAGSYLKELFFSDLPANRDLIRNGLFVLAAIDGYRCSVTYSELMNRNDHAEVLIMDEDNYEDAGKFSCLFTADFFSDRAIKAMTEIRLVQGVTP